MRTLGHNKVEEMMMECKFMEAKCRGEESDFEVMAGNESQCKMRTKVSKYVGEDSMGSIVERFGSCDSFGTKHGPFIGLRA